LTVTREEAVTALEEVSRASDRINTLKGYHHGAPHFIIWGLVWLVANTLTQFLPDQTNVTWSAALVFGVIASVATGVIQARRARPRAASSAAEARVSRRSGMAVAVVFAFIACLVVITRPETSRETNAVISIVFPFMYMGAGVWAGWRLFAIGLVTAVGIMAGFVWIEDYYPLWMGLFGGGSLIAGGLWLRSA